MDTVCRLEDELADAVATVAQVHDTGLVEPAAELFAVGRSSVAISATERPVRCLRGWCAGRAAGASAGL